MQFDPYIALAGLLVGFTVGLTGMGGGALMTPLLVLVFRVQPLAAVSSDLVASLFIKPIGGAIHARRGTVNWQLVGWLAVGSVPTAFLGVVLLRLLGDGSHVQDVVQIALGIALMLAAAGIVVKAVMNIRRGPRSVAGEITVRPLQTVLIGALGGLVVGMTSVGSGSLIIVMLMLVYPSLSASRLVGTDLVQAIPLVGSAALGHILLGDFRLGLTTSIIVGSVPGVYVGARLSANAPAGLLRRALALVLLLSGLKLVQLGNTELLVVFVLAVTAGPVLWRVVRATGGLHLRRRVAQSDSAA